MRTRSTKTHCFLGATVRDVADKATEILANDPDFSKVIIHARANDIRKQIEILKADSVHLISILKRSACAANGVCIDNFNLFWEGWEVVFFFFRNYGIHPNRLGAKLLSGNISHVVAHTPVALAHS